jgi:hypothetical protein
LSVYSSYPVLSSFIMGTPGSLQSLSTIFPAAASRKGVINSRIGVGTPGDTFAGTRAGVVVGDGEDTWDGIGV